MRRVLPKRRLTFNGLHGVVSQRIVYSYVPGYLSNAEGDTSPIPVD
jgi:hypothetical protein